MKNNEMEKRIEAAENCLWESVSWPDSVPMGHVRRIARDAIQSAFPELFADPPTAWLAPWEATDTMIALSIGYSARKDKQWARMRDAYLSPTPTEEDDNG